MNLQELNAPLPKPELNIQSNTLNCSTLSINGNPTSGTFDPQISSILNLTNFVPFPAVFLRLNNIVFISGVFLCDGPENLTAASFDITLPPGIEMTNANARIVHVSGAPMTILSEQFNQAMFCIGDMNVSPNVIRALISTVIPSVSTNSQSQMRFTYYLSGLIG